MRTRGAALALLTAGLLAAAGQPAWAGGLRCAGVPGSPAATAATASSAAAKPVSIRTTGTRHVLLVFARFRDDADGWTEVPSWASQVFDADVPGTLSHFYRTMSFGQLQLTGEVAPRVYESDGPAADYLAASPTEVGGYGTFARQILGQVDADVDFSRFDDDGPDGLPASGDDDGLVDAVFLVLRTVPERFIQAHATGVGGLGWDEDMATADHGAAGQPIHIGRFQGTVQQGRSFTEAVGALCHEYGHLLGLVDLYDTAFLTRQDADPAEDSAGAGCWDLMGWGALGWNGDDGPAGLGAYSRLRLGWAQVEEIDAPQTLAGLEDVGQRGHLVKVPLTDLEYFLLEQRTRATSWYDRHVPGEGLLIWHVARGDSAAGVQVDLECADGRWRDAGFPLGREPDPLHGEDNLDFWAHDQAYAVAHAGNLGDATDPFDGVRYRNLTADTNPSSAAWNGTPSAVRITDIALVDGRYTAQVETAPLRATLDSPVLADASGDGLIASGEEVEVRTGLRNPGGTHLVDARAVLGSADTLVHVLQPEARFGTVRAGDVVMVPEGSAFPRFVVTGPFAGVRTVPLEVSVYADDVLVDILPLSASVVSPRLTGYEAALVDTTGNGDGALQAGEVFQIAVQVEGIPAALLQALSIQLRPLDAAVRILGSTALRFRRWDGPEEQVSTRSLGGPEFVLSADTPAGRRLGFELRVAAVDTTWRDTLWQTVVAGPDPSPPRVPSVQAVQDGANVRLHLPRDWVVEGGQVEQAVVRVLAAAGRSLVAAVPLDPGSASFDGVWTGAAVGEYLLQTRARDQAGNWGSSPPQPFTVVALSPGTARAWPAPLGLPGAALSLRLEELARAPSAPDVVYAAGQEAAWRSDDDGSTWTRGGLMLGRALAGATAGSPPHLQIDAVDPLVAYAWFGSDGVLLRTADGGATWHEDALPGYPVRALVADPMLPDRLYATVTGLYASAGLGAGLLVSQDRGTTWRNLGCPGAANASALLVHPRHAEHVYVGAMADRRVPVGDRDPFAYALWHSPDGGTTWETRPLPRRFDLLACDPAAATGLYAVVGDTLWHSADAGATWEVRGPIPGMDMRSGATTVVPCGAAARLLYAFQPGTSAQPLRSEDGGLSWHALPAPVQGQPLRLVSPHPADSTRILVASGTDVGTALYRMDGPLPAWEEISLPRVQPPVGTVVFAADGTALAGSVRPGNSGGLLAALFASDDGGLTWEPQGSYNGFLASALQTIDQIVLDPWRNGWLMGHVRSYQYEQHAALNSCNGPVLYSADGGLTLQEWSVGGATLLRDPVMILDAQADGALYVADELAGIQCSADHASTFAAADKGLPAPASGSVNDLFASLALDPYRPQTLLTVRGDTLWSSASAGMSWGPVGRAPSPNVRLLAFHPLVPDRLYALTMDTLFVSADRGVSWEPLVGTPVPLTATARLRFDPRDPQRLYLVTGPRLLATADGGATWQPLGRELADTPYFNDVACDPRRPSRLLVATSWGLFVESAPVATIVESGPAATPRAFALHQCYPNPFNPRTVIPFDLAQGAGVHLTVYNAAGQPVRHLLDGELAAGPHQVVWDGADDAGRPLASGVYVCRLTAGGQMATRRLLLLK